MHPRPKPAEPDLGNDLQEKLIVDFGSTDAVPVGDSRRHLSSSIPTVASNILPPGTRIRQFIVQQFLGRGSFGEVYLARHNLLEKDFALKVPHADGFSASQAASFIHEARALAQLDHPGIVRIQEADLLDDGRPFVAMQFVHGESLEARLQRGRLGKEQACRLVAQVADAIHHAHVRGFYHRDLKPANILLDENESPHVVDFGLALRVDEQSGRAGEFAGSLAYMAPEQIRGHVHRLDGRADIWALGVILYEMLTGVRPFRGDKREVIDAILNGSPRPPRQMDIVLPPALEVILRRCCEREIEARYGSAAELAVALRACLAEMPSEQTATPVSPSTVAPNPRMSARWRWLAIGGVLILAMAGVWGLRWLSSPTPEARGPVSPTTVGSHDAPAQNLGDAEPDVPLAGGNTPDLAGDTRPLSAEFDVLIWDPQDPLRRGVSIREPKSRPLRKDDQVRIRVSLNRSAFVYVLWIDSVGKVFPVYPWSPGDWTSFSAQDAPVMSVSLPPDAESGWPIEGPAGMESLVVLARDTALPANANLADLLGQFPVQTMQHPQSLVWFQDGAMTRPEQDAVRGPKFYDPQKLHDPLVHTHAAVAKRLKPLFTVVRGVSFANHGE